MDKNNNLIEPISPIEQKAISNSDMEFISNKHLLKMQSRHTIRDFSDKNVSYSVIENCIKDSMFCTKWSKSTAMAFCSNIKS